MFHVKRVVSPACGAWREGRGWSGPDALVVRCGSLSPWTRQSARPAKTGHHAFAHPGPFHVEHRDPARGPREHDVSGCDPHRHRPGGRVPRTAPPARRRPLRASDGGTWRRRPLHRPGVEGLRRCRPRARIGWTSTRSSTGGRPPECFTWNGGRRHPSRSIATGVPRQSSRGVPGLACRPRVGLYGWAPSLQEE